MKGIKLWTIGGDASGSSLIAALEAVDQTETERVLENSIVQMPELLGEDTRLIGRQIDTPGGPLDLLGVDQDGAVVVFELKRGILTREAIAQLLDYASFIADLSTAEFSALVVQNSGKNGIEKIDDFDVWYQERFARTFEAQKSVKLGLVGLGADNRAGRIVDFLANSSVEIALLTFHGFRSGEQTLLARQVESSPRMGTQSSRTIKDSNLQQLRARVEESKAREFFDDAHGSIMKWLSPYAWPNKTGYTYSLPDTTEYGTPSVRAYLSLLVPNPNGFAVLSLQERTLSIAARAWGSIEALGTDRIVHRKGYSEVRISSARDWLNIKEKVRELCETILVEREKSRNNVDLTVDSPEPL